MNYQKKINLVKEAINILNNGGVILYPTDTIWGIGCDATNKDAVQKIYSIKKRDNRKPLIILIHNKNLLLNYVKSVPKIANDIIDMERLPTTIIYSNPINLPDILVQKNTIGIRVVKNHSINMLLRQFQKPLTSTSANISNNKNPLFFSEIDEEIKNQVDYIFPENFGIKKSINKASKIIKIHNNSHVEIIRE